MKKDFYKTDSQDEFIYKICWNIYPKIVKNIKIKKGDKILDAGCGEGLLSLYLKYKNLYGFDFNEKALEKAREKNYKKVFKKNIYNLNFKKNEFDQTICIEVLQYLKNPNKAFEELLRITKKNLTITSTNYQWFKIKSIFSKKFRKKFGEIVKKENLLDSNFFEKIAKDYNLNVKIKYVSNKRGFLRNIFGRLFSSEIIAIFEK